jgi:hypothetical protein
MTVSGSDCHLLRTKNVSLTQPCQGVLVCWNILWVVIVNLNFVVIYCVWNLDLFWIYKLLQRVLYLVYSENQFIHLQLLESIHVSYYSGRQFIVSNNRLFHSFGHYKVFYAPQA